MKNNVPASGPSRAAPLRQGSIARGRMSLLDTGRGTSLPHPHECNRTFRVWTKPAGRIRGPNLEPRSGKGDSPYRRSWTGSASPLDRSRFAQGLDRGLLDDALSVVPRRACVPGNYRLDNGSPGPGRGDLAAFPEDRGP